jgi:hypothetical protein
MATGDAEIAADVGEDNANGATTDLLRVRLKVLYPAV